MRSQLHSLFQFRSTLLQGGVFGLERSHCLFLPEQLGLFSIRSSVHIQIRFSNSLSSSFIFLFFSFTFLRMRRFVSLLGIVACGVHSVLFVGSSKRRQYRHVRVKQCGAYGRLYCLLAILLVLTEDAD